MSLPLNINQNRPTKGRSAVSGPLESPRAANALFCRAETAAGMLDL
jgi:hypothetical protein